jgi:hypothetical protein
VRIKSFTIKEECFTSVPNIRPITFVMDDGSKVEGTSYGHLDHPEFTSLRDKLEELGYIKTERTYWNGDYVLKPFKLNDMPFKKDDKFPCASAMQVKLSVYRKFKNER